MVSSLHHLANREFYRALKELRGVNVLVLLADGSAVFGLLEGIDDCVVTIIPAMGVAGVINVRFRPPNALLLPDILLGEMLIDVCNISAVIDGPFLVSPLSKGSTPAAFPPEAIKPISAKPNLYRQPPRLPAILHEFVGQNIGVLLIGGWVIGGQLWEIADCMIFIVPGISPIVPPLTTLGALNIFGPALASGTLNMFGTFRSWINLKALTGALYL